MLYVIIAGLVVLTIVVFVLYVSIDSENNKLNSQIEESKEQFKSLTKSYSTLKQQFLTLKERYERWVAFDNAEEHVREIHAEAQKLKQDSKSALANAQVQATNIIQQANQESEKILEDAKRRESLMQSNAENKLNEAKRQADEFINKANNSYEDIVASARSDAAKILQDAQNTYNELVEPARSYTLKLQQDANQLVSIVTALENTVKGYGNDWIIPGVDVLDELAEELAYTEPGKKLRDIKARIKDSIADGDAALCDYAEQGRKENACLFVIDAFNGKVDSILARVKRDNYGKLSQQMKDSFALVNKNGQAFRNARITKPFLELRLEQLKWAVAAFELKEQQKEEQAKIRAQMRDEEKARREIEKAQKQAAKEEADLQKAMEKARLEMENAAEEQRQKMEAASTEQRAQMEAEAAAQRLIYEQKLEELNERLKEAEEKNQRAISQAQLTKSGHVYIISNKGSFGENIYKIGMTRRLEPLDRVKELGTASVPFPFDVHALIYSEDAPGLETALHKHFVLGQVNKVNHRREFFRVNISDLKEEIEKMGLSEITWTLAAEAREYQETQAIEQQIANNPEAKDAWIRRQFKLDDFDRLANYDVADGNESDDDL